MCAFERIPYKLPTFSKQMLGKISMLHLAIGFESPRVRNILFLTREFGELFGVLSKCFFAFCSAELLEGPYRFYTVDSILHIQHSRFNTVDFPT